jgi:hypothetical protein
MPSVPVTLTGALLAIGKAVPLVGDWTTVGGLIALGATEGPITETGIGGGTINGLTAVEHTGGLLHQATMTPGAIAVNIPLIIGDNTVWAKISPTGTKSGPTDNPPKVIETGLMLVPLSAFPVSGGIGYSGSVWTPTGVDTDPNFLNSVLFGRGFFTFADVAHPFDNGGKTIVTVTYTPMYDSRLPAGKRGWVRGNPVTEGVTTFRL